MPQFMIDADLRNALLAYMEAREGVKVFMRGEIPMANEEMRLASMLRDLKALREVVPA